MNVERQPPGVRSPYRRGDFIYSLLLFVSAAAILAWIGSGQGILTGGYGWRTALFFCGFALFTITMGYARPGFGHVSFDRAAQVASILVLGPFDAAWINGLASLIYPWHRLRLGVPLPTVLTAALNNSGMMSILILACGSLYVYVGGQVPLAELSPRTAALLLLLVLTMQMMNDFAMLIIVWLRNGDTGSILNLFSTTVELVSSLIAVVIALVMVRLDFPVFALLLVVLSLGMLVLKRYAEMRLRLEALVEERTLELREKSLELERQATHDKLTGIFNRRYADDFLQREIENARRHHRELTVALADIDHFKRINDDYSHAAGDAVLRIVAGILTDRCRKTDVVARYGGEEFLLCFPDTTSEFAERICAQIRVAVENADWSPIAHLVGEGFGITISFGIAEAAVDYRRTTILNVADSRLYQAKHAGRNRIVA